MLSVRLTLLAAVAGIALAGCDTWMGDSKTPLPGQRLSVLSLDRKLEPDPTLASLDVRLPRPIVNADWPQAGGYPNHVMQHLALDDNPKRMWSVSAGDGSSRSGYVLSQPVVWNSHVYTMDAASEVRAFDAASGKRLWSVDVTPKGQRGYTFGGGIAIVDGRVFVTSGYAQVLALDAESGKEIWRQPVGAPVRGAPTVADGRVFAITVENELNVLSAEDGRKLWTHNGTAETAGLLGGETPAVEGDVVVVPYSSGEIFALRVENGRPLWSDNLATAGRFDAMSSLADIRGRPVIDRGRVYAISHSGRMVSINLRTGERIWEEDIGGTYTPWVAGDFIYVLSNNSELICLTRNDGRTRWVLGLPRYENLEKKRGPLRWSGPVLAGDRLIVVASSGEAMSVSPYTGKALGRISLPDGAFVAPVISERTLYVLTDDADLIAMR
jgi:outer membrane protein assembly factor BamB